MTTDRALVVANDATLSKLETVRNVLAPDLSDHELQLFALVAQRSGLDPFAKQIYAVKRQGKVTFQTGIDGYRSTAAKTNEYDGSDEPEYGDIITAPFPHPEWARVTVYRLRPDGTRRPQSATAWWSEFYPGESQGHMWKKMPRNQLAKCAEALALRKAFPYVLADLYTDEEMDQAGGPESAPLIEAAAQPTARERVAARRQAIESGEVVEQADPRGFALPMNRPLPLSYDSLRVLIQDSHVDTAYAAAKFGELYADRASAKDLTDEERGLLWKAIAEPPVASPAEEKEPVEAPSIPIFDEADEAVIDKALSA